tara:strand:+ start:358 stop:1134 length:777 start_codon:yes stop_codon:yes gene_type:complete
VSYNTDINIVGSIPDYHLIYKALPLLIAKDDQLIQMLVKDNEFNLRTEKSRERFLSVLNSAFINENTSINEFVGKIMSSSHTDDKNKSLFLFWIFNINNELFRELNNRLFLKYFYLGRAEFPAKDVEAYLKDLINRTLELQGRWSESTIETIASKYLTILKKLNLLEGTQKKSFCFVRVSDELIVCLIHLYSLMNQQGANFLDHECSKWIFISKDSVLERLKKIGKKGWIKMNYTGSSLRVESVFNNNNIIDGIFSRS